MKRDVDAGIALEAGFVASIEVEVYTDVNVQVDDEIDKEEQVIVRAEAEGNLENRSTVLNMFGVSISSVFTMALQLLFDLKKAEFFIVDILVAPSSQNDELVISY